MRETGRAIMLMRGNNTHSGNLALRDPGRSRRVPHHRVGIAAWRPGRERRRARALLARELGRRPGVDRVDHPPQDPRDPGRRGVDPRPLPVGHLGVVRREGGRELPPLRGERAGHRGVLLRAHRPHGRVDRRTRAVRHVPRARRVERDGGAHPALSCRLAGDAREGPRPVRPRRLARRVSARARRRRCLGHAAAGGPDPGGGHDGDRAADPGGGPLGVLPDARARRSMRPRSARTTRATRRRSADSANGRRSTTCRGCARTRPDR